MEEYKDDIISTRKGCLGSSDAKMLQQIALLGAVPKSSYKRLAIVKGLAEQKEIHTPAMIAGDGFEQEIFRYISHDNDKYQSNPRWESKKYSRPNVKCIDHPDIVLEDAEKETIYVWEVKASKLNIKDVCDTYKAQLMHHILMAKERAMSMKGSKCGAWKVKVMLAYYDTNGLDLTQPLPELDPSRLTIKECRFSTQSYDLIKAMDIVDSFLSGFDFYSEDDEIDAQYLPAEVYSQFSGIANVLREIKEREEKVETFKRRLYDFLTEKGIKKVSCDDFSFTVVQPTSTVSVDYKSIFETEIAAKHPRIAKALQESHKKVVNRKGYVQIKTK